MPLGERCLLAPTNALTTHLNLGSGVDGRQHPRPQRAFARAPSKPMGWSRSGKQLVEQAAQLFSKRRPPAGSAWRALRSSATHGEPAPNGVFPGPQAAQSKSGGGGSPAAADIEEQILKQRQWGLRSQQAQQQQQQQQPWQQGQPPSAAVTGPPPSLPTSQQRAQQQLLLPAAVEALFARAASDPALQRRLRASTSQPSVFLREFVGGGAAGSSSSSKAEQERFAVQHGLDERAVFRAIRAASKQQPQQAGLGAGAGPEGEGVRELGPVLAQLRALAEEWEARRTGRWAPPPQEPVPPPGGLADTGAATAGYPAAATQVTLSSRQQQQQPFSGPPAGQPQQPQPGSRRVSIRDLLNGRGIMLPQYAPGTYNHLLCPSCKGGAKGEKTLSVTIDSESRSAVWNCFRSKCGSTGSVHVDRGSDYMNDSGFPVTSVRKRKEEPPVRPDPALLEPPAGEVLEFLLSRGLSQETLARNGVAQQRLWVPASGREETVIAFPYYRDGQLVNIKYRTLDKKFWQVKGAEKVLYGLDDIVGVAAPGGPGEVVVVEGEIDKLSLEEAGLRHVVSVPDGAPARVREGELPPAAEDTKFSYLWNCRAWLDQAPKIIIATDNDAPGDALAEELARRLGRERCWRVRWPFNKADHEYVGALAGLAVPMGEPQAAAAAAAAAPKGEAAGDLRAGAAELAGEAAAEAGGDGEDAAAGAGLAGAAGAAVADAGMAAGSPPLEAPELLPAPGDEASGSGSEDAADLEGGIDGAAARPLLQSPDSAVQIQEAWYRKDANEVLLKDGPDFLRAFVANAEPLPIRGLLRFHEYYEDIMKHYYLQLKDAQGVSTGWPALDAFYKVVPGELTIVTGVPNSGKSEWIDALLCNLSDQHGWTFAMCSMEKKATDHARHLVEKCVGKPFFDLPYARGVPRMTQDELDAGLDWVDDRFHLIRYEDDNLPSIDWVLDIAKAAVYRYGIRGLVIDPYNELDHQRPPSQTETEYVSQMLGKIKRFAQTCGVHVWFVAHPRQLREWKGAPPNLYDISGSAHFINKADNGIVVHRNRDPDAPNTPEVQILVRKVRNKAAGTLGDCVLEYDRVTGRYLDPENEAGSARTARRVDYAALAAQQAEQAVAQQLRAAQQGLAGSGGGGQGVKGNGSNGRSAAGGFAQGGGAVNGGGTYISEYGTLESHLPGGGFE